MFFSVNLIDRWFRGRTSVAAIASSGLSGWRSPSLELQTGSRTWSQSLDYETWSDNVNGSTTVVVMTMRSRWLSNKTDSCSLTWRSSLRPCSAQLQTLSGPPSNQSKLSTCSCWRCLGQTCDKRRQLPWLEAGGRDAHGAGAKHGKRRIAKGPD